MPASLDEQIYKWLLKQDGYVFMHRIDMEFYRYGTYAVREAMRVLVSRDAVRYRYIGGGQAEYRVVS